MLTIKRTAQFKRDFRKIIRQGYDTRIFFEIIDNFARQEKLEEKYNDHALKGNWKKFRECHIAPDWLLIYLKDDENLILTLIRTGNHNDLFN